MVDSTLTPAEQALLQQLYDNVFTRWSDVHGDTLTSVRHKGYALMYGTEMAAWYAGFYTPASPHLEDQPVAITEFGAAAIGQPWPIAPAHRDRVWQREIDLAKQVAAERSAAVGRLKV
jgi:hypothetical protein